MSNSIIAETSGTCCYHFLRST